MTHIVIKRTAVPITIMNYTKKISFAKKLNQIVLQKFSNFALWGRITGLLSEQTDLQNALNQKSDTTLAIALSVAL
ncbi:MAG: hypothetical protein WCJ84_00390 [Candidatus Peregrinibacteria bacterium]